jgi:hypothetical protein
MTSSGKSISLGDGVRALQLGDRVADITVVGSNATYRTLQAERVTRVPAGVDAAEAATLILSWTTAYQLLHREARVQRGQRVLVHGCKCARNIDPTLGIAQSIDIIGRVQNIAGSDVARSVTPLNTWIPRPIQ